jgi:hypothetical protein
LEDIVGTVGEEIGPRLTSSGVTWAVTGALASTLLAPYLTAITVIELYVDADLFATPQRVEQLVEGRIVDKGHRVEIRELPTPVSSRGPTIEDVHVALPARVYADLVATGGRSAEAANHLRETYGVGPSS